MEECREVLLLGLPRGRKDDGRSLHRQQIHQCGIPRRDQHVPTRLNQVHHGLVVGVWQSLDIPFSRFRRSTWISLQQHDPLIRSFEMPFHSQLGPSPLPVRPAHHDQPVPLNFSVHIGFHARKPADPADELGVRGYVSGSSQSASQTRHTRKIRNPNGTETMVHRSQHVAESACCPSRNHGFELVCDQHCLGVREKAVAVVADDAFEIPTPHQCVQPVVLLPHGSREARDLTDDVPLDRRPI